jgi:two-component system, NtrC family, response regulator HydG
MNRKTPHPTKTLLDRARRAAQSGAPILIMGEPGTDKDKLARYILAYSTRRSQPFITANCTAVPKPLLEAELFGSLSASENGIKEEKKGKFLEADGGTLFIDEISEAPLHIQPKLLRALQEGEVESVGGSVSKIDVRFIAATRKNLRKQVEAGLFREDLFYRVNVIPLQILPLRKRPDELHALIAFFITKYCRKHGKPNLSASADALRLMENYSWPGNIRELENALERAVVLCMGHQILSEDLPGEISDAPEDSGHLEIGEGMTMEEIELSAIQLGLKRNRGDKIKTAEDLGISLRTIYRKLVPTRK